MVGRLLLLRPRLDVCGVLLDSASVRWSHASVSGAEARSQATLSSRHPPQTLAEQFHQGQVLHTALQDSNLGCVACRCSHFICSPAPFTDFPPTTSRNQCTNTATPLSHVCRSGSDEYQEQVKSGTLLFMRIKKQVETFGLFSSNETVRA